jgi:hypothetical protein
LGRFGTSHTGGFMLANQLQRVLSGGIYYLEPSYLLGDYLHDEG